MSNHEQLQPLLLFKDEFTFEPKIRNGESLKKYDDYLVCGMGGSAISVSFLKMLFPVLPLSLHNSYGLPKNIGEKTLIIVNSYSGNTEEAIDSYTKAIKAGYSVIAISKGGELIRLAKQARLPYIELPESGLEPRFAIGHQMVAILTSALAKNHLKLLREAASGISQEKSIEAGDVLASRFAKVYPVLYSSPLLHPLTYPIKAAVNEGAKLPCFTNVIPEANHNELQGFVIDNERNESAAFGFLFFVSTFDNERIKRRMNTMMSLYSSKGFACEEILIDHSSPSSLLESLFLGYAFATALAINRNVDPYTTPFIQEFKKIMNT
jgi:glucose/mannose-6-phosphate isomerase